MNIIQTNLQWRGEFQEGNKPNEIILHHAEASQCTVQDIDRWHKGRGWCGIGYHYFVRKDGSIYKGRPDNCIGAHCLGHNTNTIGICAEGSYMTETMPEVQKQAIIELCQELCSKYGISNIKGHKEENPTACPGSNYPLDEIRQSILNKPTIIIPVAPKANPIVISIQHLCNFIGLRDENGSKLDEDGVRGTHTNAAIAKLPLLRRGSKGDYVRWLQQRLIDLGFSCGSYGADGDFGYATLTAVQNFQASRHIANDGIVGQITLNELLK